MGDARIFGNPPYMTILNAAKASGKSILVKYLLYIYSKDFSYITIISPTALTGFYAEFIPQTFIHDKYDDSIIDAVIKKQEGFRKAGKNIQTCIVLDDILADTNIRMDQRKANIMAKLYAANRHWGISLIICSQKLTSLPRLCRDNVDYCCIGRTMRSAWDQIYNDFGNMPKDEFYKMLENGTRDWRFLLYKAQVKRASEHFKCFSVPPEFLEKRFRLVF